MHVPLVIVLLIALASLKTHPTVANMEQSQANITQKSLATHLRSNVTETGFEGRGKKLEKYVAEVAPLVAGLKLTALVSAAITAVKIFVVQAVVVSKVALLGATLLALKLIYDHIMHKYPYSKGVGWEQYYTPWDWYSHPYPQTYHPHTDWGSSDLHSLPSEPLQSSLPHVHGNTTFSVRSDIPSKKWISRPGAVGYETLIARITETTTADD